MPRFHKWGPGRSPAAAVLAQWPCPSWPDRGRQGAGSNPRPAPARAEWRSPSGRILLPAEPSGPSAQHALRQSATGAAALKNGLPRPPISRRPASVPPGARVLLGTALRWPSSYRSQLTSASKRFGTSCSGARDAPLRRAGGRREAPPNSFIGELRTTTPRMLQRVECCRPARQSRCRLHATVPQVGDRGAAPSGGRSRAVAVSKLAR